MSSRDLDRDDSFGAEPSRWHLISRIPQDVSVLILAGDADRLARPAEAQSLYHQVATHGRLVLFPGAGHHDLPGSALDLFKRTLLEFCREIEGRGRFVNARSEANQRR